MQSSRKEIELKICRWKKDMTSCLDSTAGNHLLAEVVLVLANRAIPFRDGLVFANENLLSNLV